MNELIRQRQEQMEHSSLSVKEEKAALQEMKRMKEDAKRYLEWETELDGMKHKRAVCAEQLRLGFEQLDEQRNIAFRVEAASALSMPVEMLEESKLSVGEALHGFESAMLRRAAPKVASSREKASVLHAKEGVLWRESRTST